MGELFEATKARRNKVRLVCHEAVYGRWKIEQVTYRLLGHLR